MSEPNVIINARVMTRSNSLMLSAIEEHLDSDYVHIQREAHAVKAVLPLYLEIILSTVGGILLEKLVLEPLFNAIKGKVKDLFNKNNSLHIVIKFLDSNFIFDTGILGDESTAKEILEFIRPTYSLLQEHDLVKTISKVRIEKSEGKVLILAYETNKPKYRVDIDSSEIIAI